MPINLSAIENAKDTVELEEALTIELDSIGCQLDSDSTYEESYEWYAQDGKDGDSRAVEILGAAIKRWHELEAS